MSNCNQGELAIRCVTNCLYKIDNDATVFNRPGPAAQRRRLIRWIADIDDLLRSWDITKVAPINSFDYWRRT